MYNTHPTLHLDLKIMGKRSFDVLYAPKRMNKRVIFTLKNTCYLHENVEMYWNFINTIIFLTLVFCTSCDFIHRDILWTVHQGYCLHFADNLRGIHTVIDQMVDVFQLQVTNKFSLTSLFFQKVVCFSQTFSFSNLFLLEKKVNDIYL